MVAVKLLAILILAAHDAYGKACNGLCGQGEGDCDSDDDCLDGLKCNYDSWFWTTDYCKAGPNTKNYEWSKWGDWDDCSVQCGDDGTQERFRFCNPPENGGFPCPSQLDSETKPCNNGPCPVDGGWGEWSAWELCPVSCGGADYSRTRSCDSPAPLYGGKVCPGIAIESRRCNENPCPIAPLISSECKDKDEKICPMYVQTYGDRFCGFDWFIGDDGRYGCKESCDLCPVDCEWGDWAIGECSTTCGDGTRTNTREKLVEEKNGGSCNGTATTTESCNAGECPPPSNPNCNPKTWESYNKECCTPDEPCGLGEGDCDIDDECAGDFVCGTNNCLRMGSGFNKKSDCCELPRVEGFGNPNCVPSNLASLVLLDDDEKNWMLKECCSKEKPCGVGQGDCDMDSECEGKLKCGDDNCDASFWDSRTDCCE